MIRKRSPKKGRKYRIEKVNGAWCLFSCVFDIKSIDKLFDFLFENDKCYVIIEFGDESIKNSFIEKHDVLFARDKKVCVVLSMTDTKNVVAELFDLLWNGDNEGVYYVHVVDIVCDINAVRDAVVKHKAIDKTDLSTFFIGDDPFDITCTIDFKKNISRISRNFLGQHSIELPFGL